MSAFDPLQTLAEAGTTRPEEGGVSFQSNQDFIAALASLVDRWCEERRLEHLAAVLPSFLAFNGLTDGWADLRSGLRSAVGLGANDLPDEEWDTLQSLSRDADNVLSRR
jgi:hypothetical protein